MNHIIYQITNNINQKIYIGCHQTSNVDDGYMGSGKLLPLAYRKYGQENFTKDILHLFDTSEKMFAKEAEIVNELFVSRKDTYNIKQGGYGGWDHYDRTGCIRSTETRSKISSSLKGNVPWMKGKQHTEETKRKIGLASRGRKHSEETLAKISEANKGRISPNKGNVGKYKHSEEAKRKISQLAKGHTRNTGRTHSEETKRKISEAAKKRWAKQKIA